MEEYSDLKFDGDLSFLNENLDAAKNAQKEQIIKNQLAKEDSVKLAREEIAKQETAKSETSHEELTKLELLKEETARLAREELARQEFAKQELAREEVARLAREEFAKQELERAEIARLAKEEFEKSELVRQGLIKAPLTYLSQELTQKPTENANERMNFQNNNSVKESENYVAPKTEQGMMSLNSGTNSEKKSQLEEMILNSGYGAEMFNNLKMELLELEKEKIIMKYKQDLMMMIIKS